MRRKIESWLSQQNNKMTHFYVSKELSKANQEVLLSRIHPKYTSQVIVLNFMGLLRRTFRTNEDIL